jgi:UDP-N-acetylglucosamine diphosphorylase/glucosamine-1-phosphate N-acetyltransferase
LIDLLLQRNKGKNFVVMKEGAVALAFLKEAKAKEVAATLKAPLGASFSKSIRAFAQAVDGEGLELLRYPWGIIEKNAELIREDFKAHPRDSQSTLDTSVHVEGGKENLLVGEKTFVEGGVVIDVRDGPVWIGDDVYVQAPSRISGPTYVGDGSIIFGAQLREGTSIGRVCRIGGEVEETVFQAYSNKRHVGFIGHAYVGEWVNMGSGTQNSDLKNTYGTVKVTIGGKKVDTGKAFVGCVIGDHAKMSIGSQIFTGKTVGVSSQALGTVIEDIPSFTIWGKTLGMGAVELRIDSAVETARRVQARRKVELTKDDEELLRKVFQMTSVERRSSGVRKKALHP